MEKKISETQPVEFSTKLTPPWSKSVLFAILTLVLAGGLVFAGYKFGQRQTQPQISLAPTPTIAVSRPSLPVDLGPESFILERLDKAPFVVRLKVVDIFSSQPIAGAKVILEVALACPDVVGVKCERPEFVETTDEEGVAIFSQKRLKEFLEGTSVSLSVEAIFYENYSHEIPFGPTPIDIVVKLLGSLAARVTNQEQAFEVSENQSEVAGWLAGHQKSPGFGKSAKFEKPFWIVEYQDKFACPKGYDPSDPNCVLRVKIDAQTGTVSIPAISGQITVKQSGGAGLLIAECGHRNYISNAADYIIEGTVRKVESKWSEERTSIFTYTNLMIEKYVKGTPFLESELQIITPGGTVGEISQEVEDQPIFHEGKRVRIYFKEANGEFLIVCGPFGVEELQ